MNSYPITYFKAQRWAKEKISNLYEIDPNAPQYLLKMRHQWDDTHLLLANQVIMPETEWSWFQTAVKRLIQGEPAQYIAGQASFYGRSFKINNDVLIPEVETVELVEWVLATQSESELTVLDLGTGSGVIGITLALERPEWRVTLSDISSKALDVAKTNLAKFDLDLRLIRSDLFENLRDEKFDLIVTNPPYISKNDLASMDQSVIDYEPAIALFADNNGLGFYQRLFKEIPNYLTDKGQLFGETGYDQEASIQQLFYRINPTAHIETRHDVAGKMRMIHAWEF